MRGKFSGGYCLPFLHIWQWTLCLLFLCIADHFGVTVAEKLHKDELRNVGLSSLFDQGVLQGGEKGVCEAQLGPSPGSLTAAPHTAGLTFEQQKELLTSQFEQDKLHRQETLELERLRQSTERMKLELEQSEQLICEGMLSSGVFSNSASDTGSGGADIAACLRLVSTFHERDPVTFFTLFERVAEALQWPDSDRVLLLQCIFTGRAQEAYSAICAEESLTYVMAKSAVLKAYDLVPEAYLQKFRHWVKGERQINVDFVRD